MVVVVLGVVDELLTLVVICQSISPSLVVKKNVKMRLNLAVGEPKYKSDQTRPQSDLVCAVLCCDCDCC